VIVEIKPKLKANAEIKQRQRTRIF